MGDVVLEQMKGDQCPLRHQTSPSHSCSYTASSCSGLRKKRSTRSSLADGRCAGGVEVGLDEIVRALVRDAWRAAAGEGESSPSAAPRCDHPVEHNGCQ